MPASQIAISQIRCDVIRAEKHHLKLKKAVIRKLMIVRAVIEWDESAQSYSATCPELNFVSSFGDTKEQAIANLEDAIKLMLEPIPDDLYLEDSTSEQIELVL